MVSNLANKHQSQPRTTNFHLMPSPSTSITPIPSSSFPASASAPTPSPTSHLLEIESTPRSKPSTSASVSTSASSTLGASSIPPPQPQSRQSRPPCNNKTAASTKRRRQPNNTPKKVTTPKCSGRWSRRSASWTPEEDARLIELVQRENAGPPSMSTFKTWSRVATQLVNRTGKQCRERYLNQLKPGIKRDAWGAHEECILHEAHAKYGNKWVAIAGLLPGRTDNCVKNHWNSMLRKQQRRQVALAAAQKDLKDKLRLGHGVPGNGVGGGKRAHKIIDDGNIDGDDDEEQRGSMIHNTRSVDGASVGSVGGTGSSGFNTPSGLSSSANHNIAPLNSGKGLSSEKGSNNSRLTTMMMMATGIPVPSSPCSMPITPLPTPKKRERDAKLQISSLVSSSSPSDDNEEHHHVDDHYSLTCTPVSSSIPACHANVNVNREQQTPIHSNGSRMGNAYNNYNDDDDEHNNSTRKSIDYPCVPNNAPEQGNQNNQNIHHTITTIKRPLPLLPSMLTFPTTPSKECDRHHGKRVTSMDNVNNNTTTAGNTTNRFNHNNININNNNSISTLTTTHTVSDDEPDRDREPSPPPPVPPQFDDPLPTSSQQRQGKTKIRRIDHLDDVMYRTGNAICTDKGSGNPLTALAMAASGVPPSPLTPEFRGRSRSCSPDRQVNRPALNNSIGADIISRGCTMRHQQQQGNTWDSNVNIQSKYEKGKEEAYVAVRTSTVSGRSLARKDTGTVVKMNSNNNESDGRINNIVVAANNTLNNTNTQQHREQHYQQQNQLQQHSQR